MNWQKNISLKTHNTFGINVIAENFATFDSIDVLENLLSDVHDKPLLVLGGGSNMLFTKDVTGYVLKNNLCGIELIKEDEDSFYIQAMAGENWHLFVQHCIEQNYAGLENLSLIPGNVGASPMQNIGAYGVEIKDIFHSLSAYHIQDKKNIHFNKADCAFGYRESIFKRKYKEQFIILSVVFKLSKKPVFKTTYGAIEQQLDNMGVKDLSIRAVADAVIAIRKSKLPDPAVTGNAGSFFKNPTITKNLFEALKSTYPTIPGFDQPNGAIKIPAAWLIEQCGWKGFRDGDAGCHPLQPLVLVNYGHATGQEIFRLSTNIMLSVKDKFNVELEREVNII